MNKFIETKQIVDVKKIEQDILDRCGMVDYCIMSQDTLDVLVKEFGGKVPCKSTYKTIFEVHIAVCNVVPFGEYDLK